MKTIAVVQQKGGVGKTTLVLNLALYFAHEGVDVAVADADSQGSLTAAAELLEGVEVVSVAEALSDGLAERISLTLIDTSPRNDVSLAQILSKADFILIPTRPGFFDIMAMKDTEALLQQAGATGRAGIVLNMVQHRNSLNREMSDMLKRFAIPVLDTQIFQRVAYARSSMTNGVFGSDDQKARQEIEALANEIFEKL